MPLPTSLIRQGSRKELDASGYFLESDHTRVTRLSEPIELYEIDGQGNSTFAGHWTAACPDAAAMNAFVVWFEARLSSDVWLRTAPGGPPTTWGLSVIPLEKLHCRAGMRVRFELVREGYSATVRASACAENRMH